MGTFTYIDSNGAAHSLPAVRFGSLSGTDGNTGTVQTVSNADYSAVIKTRISKTERTIALTIPVQAESAAALETAAGTYLSWFRQSDEPATLQYERDDGTCREVEVYVQQGYPVRTYESNTFCWVEVRFTACSPYWTSTEETAFKHNTAFVNDGDYPAECKLILSVTVRYVALDGVQIMAFRDGAYMLTNYVTITDSSITATDTSGNNILYKFTLDSKFPLIPTGEHIYYGCKGTFKKRWGHA